VKIEHVAEMPKTKMGRGLRELTALTSMQVGDILLISDFALKFLVHKIGGSYGLRFYTRRSPLGLYVERLADKPRNEPSE